MKTSKDIIGFLCELDYDRRIYVYPNEPELQMSKSLIIICEDDNINIKRKIRFRLTDYTIAKAALNG